MRKLLYFHASWCGPCKMVDREFLSKVEAEVNPEQIVRIDAQNEAVTADKYGVDKLPTTIILDGDRVVFKKWGGFDVKEVIKLLNDNS